MFVIKCPHCLHIMHLPVSSGEFRCVSCGVSFAVAKEAKVLKKFEENATDIRHKLSEFSMHMYGLPLSFVLNKNIFQVSLVTPTGAFFDIGRVSFTDDGKLVVESMVCSIPMQTLLDNVDPKHRF